MSREKVSRRQKDISRVLRDKKKRQGQDSKKSWKKKPS
jgi:hypothetical protein